MKSLEALKNIRREAGFPYFSTLYDIDMWNEDFETIRKSLEVLEIIRKKNVNINRLKTVIRLVKEGIFKIEEALKLYNFHEDNLTLEELLKLKQWLEENE